ncbi:Uncharacterised protein [Neisseria gonorrhoeae]|nr:hypothetical protein NGFG_02332 [Neisseria gonorrhoeae MS11]AKP16002.1 hypothetical protein WX61_01975 [Neisseria gonorrhoeae]QBK51678.1 hypothetical protein TFGA2_00635 [Neisseria gonorrhoeae]QBK54227.1 hypothetical protein TFGB2_01021 [Neisseria gonorrhoeae]CNO59050.1 Uncharacterised protein [Neisseria gonorrhoeae]
MPSERLSDGIGRFLFEFKFCHKKAAPNEYPGSFLLI